MLDVLSTPGHKQSHKYRPQFGMVSAKDSQAAWTVCGSHFCWELKEYCIPIFGNSGWFPGSPMPCCTSWSCPALGHLPSLLVTLRVLPGIPLAAELSCLISLSRCKQGRGGWKRGKGPCIPEQERGFGNSTTAGCLHKQIPHLVITFWV